MPMLYTQRNVKRAEQQAHYWLDRYYKADKDYERRLYRDHYQSWLDWLKAYDGNKGDKIVRLPRTD